nr:ATP-binding cassette domain-containing protein [uncultured Brevundimonas sp.]
MIDIRDLALTLPSRAGPVEILKDIDLTVSQGERVSVVGPSGSGKTSLIMVMAGLERPTAGSLRIDGQELTALDEDELAGFRLGRVGVVFQDFHLVPTMTALENVAIPLELAGQPDPAARAAAALESVGLGHRLQHFPGQLSGGEQQRTALARAFVPEPRLLLADEPTGNLDGETGETVVELLFALAEKNATTLLLITHDRALAARCERRVRLLDGRIAGDEVAHSVRGDTAPVDAAQRDPAPLDPARQDTAR